jgi:hypothetical protein
MAFRRKEKPTPEVAAHGKRCSCLYHRNERGLARMDREIETPAGKKRKRVKR